MSTKSYKIACLAGDGIGPELMGEACRALHEVCRLHGFLIDDVHVPFGTEAFSRSGHPLPASTRAAYLDADAVLLGVENDPALEDIEAELDLRTTVTRVRFGAGHDLRLLSPTTRDLAEWTVERAFVTARASRARLASVDEDREWHELVDRVADRHHIPVEHLTVAAALPALAFEPERFDVLVTGPLFAGSLDQIARSIDREPLVAACGRLAGNGPGLFSPGHAEAHEAAGLGVSNPSSMLLAAATMLGDGLGEHAAAETLAAAVASAHSNGVRTLDRLLRGIAATTRQFTDSVISGLPANLSTAEFAREIRP